MIIIMLQNSKCKPHVFKFCRSSLYVLRISQGGGEGLEYWGGGGGARGANFQQAHDVVTTLMRRLHFDVMCPQGF